MIAQNNKNLNISQIYGLPLFKKVKNEGKIDLSVGNIKNRFKEIELDKNKYVSSKKVAKISNIIIKLSENIIYTNKSSLNLLDKNQYNLETSNLENLNNLNPSKIKINLNESKLILKNEQQYIKLISPLNSNLISVSNNIYTFTNKSYKKFNKNITNLYLICKSAFLNMSSIISK